MKAKCEQRHLDCAMVQDQIRLSVFVDVLSMQRSSNIYSRNFVFRYSFCNTFVIENYRFIF